MKNKKGFTLIELLAVIIILGILMLVAIPSVTGYINNSRKETYVSTIKELIRGASNLVSDGFIDIYDKDTTYYIPTSAIKLEGGKAQSPYGDIDEAYIVVTYDGEKHEYYYVGKDEANIGIKNIKRDDLLKNDSIETDVEEVSTDIGIDKRHKIVVFNDNGKGIKEEKNAEERVDGETGERKFFLCKRAKTLHTETCIGDDTACALTGYTETGSKGTRTITYGNLGTDGNLEAGDAFDCDVNGDGIYDSWNERFYYVSNTYNVFSDSFEYDKAALMHFEIYIGRYSSVEDIASIGESEGTFGYDNYHGPVSIAKVLNGKDIWKNKKIIAPGIRQITTQNGEKIVSQKNSDVYTKEYDLPQFDYKDSAARLLTYQEVVDACGDGNPEDMNYLSNKCVFLLERSSFNSAKLYDGNWDRMYLETAYSSNNTDVYYIYATRLSINHFGSKAQINYKNTIDVKLDDIDY